jgi:hypothetical protein
VVASHRKWQLRLMSYTERLTLVRQMSPGSAECQSKTVTQLALNRERRRAEG